MARKECSINIQLDERQCEGLLAWDDANEPKPGVLVCHTIRGRTDFEDDKARALADLGYTALAIDLYGLESRGSDIDQLRSLMQGLLSDRASLLDDLRSWLDVLAEQQPVSAGKLAAMGFCFGGLCVLDMARGVDQLAGVVSFHGLLGAPDLPDSGDINPRVLVLHGWDDPLATPQQVEAFAEEMSSRSADWQIHAYGNTLHAFTNPAANDHTAGTVYNQAANRRSWTAMQAFFSELFPH